MSVYDDRGQTCINEVALIEYGDTLHMSEELCIDRDHTYRHFKLKALVTGRSIC